MTQVIVALVLLVVVFTVVHRGLLSARARHSGIWVTDEVAHLLRIPDRDFFRREDMAVSWIPIPTVRRSMALFPQVALKVAVQAKLWPGFGLVLEVTPRYSAARALVDSITAFYREIGRVAVEAGRTLRETMDRVFAFAKNAGLLDEEDK